MQPVLSGRQNYLANVPALFQIGLRFADLREREALVYMGANPAIRDTVQQYSIQPVTMSVLCHMWPRFTPKTDLLAFISASG